MKATSLLRSHSLVLALAAVLLALAPGRAAADPAAIFVSNDGGGNVPAYSATGAAATGYTAPTDVEDPEGIAYNPANGMLYVADYDNSQIRTFNAITGAETSIGFANPAGLDSPVGLALNAGTLYVANGGTQTVLAYNAANGAAVTSGFTSPVGVNSPYGLAANNTTLYSTYNSRALGAFNLATGTAVAGFTPITGLSGPVGVALYGNDLFVANANSSNVGEYDATTGAVINASFVTGLNAPYGLAVLGDRLLVVAGEGTTVGAYGIPDVATLNNVPTSSDPSFLTGLNDPGFIAVAPEPSTWALLALGALGVGTVALRRRRRSAVLPN